MAIVKEWTCSNGVHVRIDDACCRDLSPEELARRRRQISEAILRIDRNAQLRALAARNERAGTRQ